MFLRYSFVVLLFVQYFVTINSSPCIFCHKKIHEKIKGNHTDESKIAFNDSVTAGHDVILQPRMKLNEVPSMKSTVENSTTDLSSSLNTSLDKIKRQSGDELSIVTESTNTPSASKAVDDVQRSLTLNATTNAAHYRNNKRPVYVNNARSSSTSRVEESRWSRINRTILDRLKSLFSTNANNNDRRNKRSVENPLENENGEEETNADQDRNQPEDIFYDELLDKDLQTLIMEPMPM
uniref:Uncharacterized protein n=1 Tax=Daphnia galeata TaxID=27404 RepID=A0A8J2S1I7_9CRUS|nr:unnamed protein product [Daphnia galeata]